MRQILTHLLVEYRVEGLSQPYGCILFSLLEGKALRFSVWLDCMVSALQLKVVQHICQVGYSHTQFSLVEMLVFQSVKAHAQLQAIVLLHRSLVWSSSFLCYLTSRSPFHQSIVDVFIPILKNYLVGYILLHPQILSNIMPCTQNIPLKLSIKNYLRSLSVMLLYLLLQLMMLLI